MSAELIGILGVGAGLVRIQFRGGRLANDHVYHWITGGDRHSRELLAPEQRWRTENPSGGLPATRSRAKRAVVGAWGRVWEFHSESPEHRARAGSAWIASLRRALDGHVSHVEQRMARLEGLIESAGLFRPAEALEPSAGD